MRWCGCKISDHGTANRTSLQDPWRLRPWIHSRFSTNLRRRFSRSFRNNSPCQRVQKLLLISSRVRTTLIVYFQLIMKICYRNWYWCLSRPSKAVDSWENSSEYAQFLVGFGSAQAGPQRTIPFFCWDRVAFFGRTGGREYSNSRNADKRKCRQIA